MNRKTKFFALIFGLILAQSLFNLLSAQISGKWHGKLIINEKTNLTVAFEIKGNKAGNLSSVMHSVDQKAFNIPVDTVYAEGNDVTIIINSLAAKYTGQLINKDGIDGHMAFPGGAQMKLDLQKVDTFPFSIAERPQEPKEPLPYFSDDIEFLNKKMGIKLKGTITTPSKEGQYPAVVLISGSGASDRNQTIFGHKTFLVMSDFLTRAGFAVLRYDDRGAAESEGSFLSATILDHAEDAAYAVDFLKSREFVDTLSIGLIGHSLGADIAPVTATINPSVSYVILMAGAAKPLQEIILEQCDAIYPTMGISDSATTLNKHILQSLFEVVRVAPDTKVAREQGALILKQFEERASALTQEDKNLIGYSTPLDIKTWSGLFIPYMKHDLFHDNERYLKQLKCPVLVIGGNKDLQVLPHHVKLIEDILVSYGNKRVTAKIYLGKNHLLQDAITGSPSEYGDIENTIAPDVINDIIHWLRTQTGRITRIN